jgi:hypothetical protein
MLCCPEGVTQVSIYQSQYVLLLPPLQDDQTYFSVSTKYQLYELIFAYLALMQQLQVAWPQEQHQVSRHFLFMLVLFSTCMHTLARMP